MSEVDAELKRVASDTVKECGCTVYHIVPAGGRLEVYVDKKGGASIADCEKITRQLGLRFQTIEQWRKLILEVSTPGIERKLYTPAHYRSAVGERVLIKIKGEALEGRLTGADKEGILLEQKSGIARRLTYNEILSTQVQRSTEELFRRR